MGLLNKATILFAVLGSTTGFSVDLSRRQAIQAAFAGAATAIAPSLVSVLPAYAMPDEETPRVVTRMGGNLVCSMWSPKSPSV